MVLKTIWTALVNTWRDLTNSHPPNIANLPTLLNRYFLGTQCNAKRVSARSFVIYHFSSIAVHVAYGDYIPDETYEPWARMDDGYMTCIGLVTDQGEFTIMYSTRHLNATQANAIGQFIAQIFDQIEIGPYIQMR